MNFAAKMLAWYHACRRDLPWRHTKDPYAVWVSEIMLQQTRVEAVKGHYARFLHALPAVRDLASCPDDTLLKLWEGLGYYSRARNMKRAACIIMEKYGGVFPDTYEAIRALPGIGSYTAGAVSSIAFDLPHPAVDGNVLRVAARLEGSDENILSSAFRKRTEAVIGEILREDVPAGNAGAFNQSLMELGAVICVPGVSPLCGECPVSAGCRAMAEGRTAELPVRIRPSKRRAEEWTVLLIRAGSRVAIRRRPDRGLLAGMYEFPMIAGAGNEAAVRETAASYGLTPLRVSRITDASHVFSHVEWHMRGYEVETDPSSAGKSAASAEPHENGLLFVTPRELEKQYAVPSAYAAYIDCLRCD